MLHQDAANKFKFDGTENADQVFLEPSLTAISTPTTLQP